MGNTFRIARKEGRICSNCGWMISREDWNPETPLCKDCQDALKGVNVSCGALPYSDDPEELTGEFY